MMCMCVCVGEDFGYVGWDGFHLLQDKVYLCTNVCPKKSSFLFLTTGCYSLIIERMGSAL